MRRQTSMYGSYMGDREALVHVALGLLLDARDDGLGRVAAVERADAADEVDVLAPVDVGQARAVGVRHEDRRGRHPARDVAASLLAVSRADSLCVLWSTAMP